MVTLSKGLGVAILAGVAALVLIVPTVSAQPLYVPTSQRGLMNPYNRLSASLAMNQWAYSASLVGRNYNALTYGTATNPYAPYGMNPAANLFGATTMAIANSSLYPVYGGAAVYGTGGGGYGGYGYAIGSDGYGGGAIAGGTATLTSSASPGLTGAQITSVPSSSYGGYSNPYGSYSGDPLYGGLSGAANVYNAQGVYQMNYQTSRLLRERVRQAQVETQRRIFDEWAYERANTPTLEDLREKRIRTAEQRAQHQPPVTEIVSGDSLNTLLNQLKGARSRPGDLDAPLPAEVIRQVNISTGSSSGGLGAIKQIKEGAPLNWPLVLQGGEFGKDRAVLENQLPRIVASATGVGRVNAEAMMDLKAAQSRMQSRLDESVGDLEPGQYIAGKRFLHQLDQAYKVLQQPDADRYFSRLDDQVKTVGDLVRVMRDKGLQFAPAANGDEAAYLALWQALSHSAARSGP